MTSFLGQEHEDVASDLSTKDLLSSLVVEVNDEGKGVTLDELGNVLFGQIVGQVIAAFIELEKKNLLAKC